ncbi:MAG: tetratricopeptide repeat protein, partial [Bryobacterales bacterium]|nr:tetratricopeptide repeat protein [Bryobacterales bacterium]
MMALRVWICFLAAVAVAQSQRTDARKAEEAFSQARKLEIGQQEQAALERFSEAIRYAPDFAAAFRHRGKLHMALGHTAEALTDLNQALRLQTDDAEAYHLR